MARHIEKVDGHIMWENEKDAPTNSKVHDRDLIDHLGFQLPHGPGRGAVNSVTILKGNPESDRVILVKAFGNSWGGEFLVSKEPPDFVKLYSADGELVEQLLQDQPKGLLSEILSQARTRKRNSVDISDLEKRSGLVVFESQGEGKYWNDDVGEFDSLPEAWILMPKGDMSLTKEVRKGPHWILRRKEKKHWNVVGTLAPEINVVDAYFRLGALKGASERSKRKLAGQEKRESRFTEQYRQAILKKYPSIPAGALKEIIETSRSPGCVGNADWLWFSSKTASESRFESAADLAVGAFVRHNYTKYECIIEGVGREEARRMVLDDTLIALDEWIKNPTKPK